MNTDLEPHPCCIYMDGVTQESLVEVGEEEFERYVGNPLNSLALVKRLSVELHKAGNQFIHLQTN